MNITRKIQRYGWKPSVKELEDVKYAIAKPVPLPSEIDMRPDFDPVYNQILSSSCTGQMYVAAYRYSMKQAGLPDFMPSRLFIYYNERLLEGTTDSDCGAEIKDAFKAGNKLGICREETWGFSDKKNHIIQKPSDAAYKEAENNKIHNYATLNNTILDELRHCMAHKFPIGFGFTVYSSFESDEVAKSGILEMPDLSKESVVGQHAVVACGYNDRLQLAYVRNSWGADWGESGYFTMPYEYICHPLLANDFWMQRLK
jgi:C1A family cysteine protease